MPLEITSADVMFSRRVGKGRIDVGLGYEKLEDPLTGLSEDDGRAYISWRNR